MSNMTTLIYGGGPFYSGGSAVIDDLKGSGFTTVVAWCIHVDTGGDLIFNNPPAIVSNGRYIGDPGWPARLADLKQGGSVNRLLFSVGSGGSQDFTNIKQLIQSQGTGPDSMLYQNFKALLAAIPVIDGIDFDDEDLLDQDTIVSFALMLQSIGYREVTFCPYMDISFWVNCLYEIDSKAPGLVTGFNLQCYAGGTGNNPADWINGIKDKMGPGFPAAGMVFPGLWCRHGDGCLQGDCPDNITDQFAAWKPSGIQGGWIWLYDDIQNCQNSGVCSEPMDTKAYAAAIVKGLAPAT